MLISILKIFRGDIRRQQIDELLQYDRNMNLQVLNLEKSGVAKMDESTDPNPLL